MIHSIITSSSLSCKNLGRMIFHHGSPTSQSTVLTKLRLQQRVLPLSYRTSGRTVMQCQYSNKPSVCLFPMKPGTPIQGLDIFKDKDPPVALPRSEYPDWINQLSTPLISLARLRKMPLEEASDFEQRRFLKLTRRMKIKANNESMRKD